MCIYNSLQMRIKVRYPAATKVFVGPAEQEDIQALMNDLVRIGSTLNYCYDDVQVIYTDRDKLSSDVLKRNSQQLPAANPNLQVCVSPNLLLP